MQEIFKAMGHVRILQEPVELTVETRVPRIHMLGLTPYTYKTAQKREDWKKAFTYKAECPVWHTVALKDDI
jgi:hypothetical protein